MTREEKIRTLDNFCDKWELCSDGCPLKNLWRGTSYDCEWRKMTDDRLDKYLDYLDTIRSANFNERTINPSNSNPDMVNHPSHYCQGGIECIDAIKAATVNKRGIEAVCVANVIKYLFRYETKNGLEDVKKAAWYIDRLIKELEAKGE